VLDAYRKRFPRAVIRTVSSIPFVGGGISWKIEGTEDGFARDLSCRADLSLISFREGIPATALPEAVTAGAAKRYPGSPITTADRLISDFATRHLLTLNGPEKPIRLALTPDGETLSPSGPSMGRRFPLSPRAEASAFAPHSTCTWRRPVPSSRCGVR